MKKPASNLPVPLNSFLLIIQQPAIITLTKWWPFQALNFSKTFLSFLAISGSTYKKKLYKKRDITTSKITPSFARLVLLKRFMPQF